MFISEWIIGIVVLIGMYYGWRHLRTRRLANYMKDMSFDKDLIFFGLNKHSSNRGSFEEGFNYVFPKYEKYMQSRYASAGTFGNRHDEYLYSMSKLSSSYDFLCATLFRFINSYIDDNPYELSEFRNGKHYKTELCKALDEVYICTAKECSQIKNIHKYAFIDLNLIERYVASETIQIIRL